MRDFAKLTRCGIAVFACLLGALAPAMADGGVSADLIARVDAAVNADTSRLTAIFKDIHQHPEIAFHESRTAAMDANAVREATGLPYAATAKQRLADGNEIEVMHACGHDAHVTWMLGMAKAMVALRAAWSRTLVEDKLWERGFPRPDYAFGAHTAPGPVGYISSSPGARMAGVDQLDINIKGIGGHGSTPQMTIDPVVREQMLKRIDEISKGVAVAAGVGAELMPTRVMKGYSGPLINDLALVERINPSLERLMGEGRVIDHFPAVMGSEDFQEAFTTLGKVPYVFFLVGVAPPEMFAKAQAAGRPFPYSNHNPDFFVDLAAIPIGAKVDTVAVLSVLAKP